MKDEDINKILQKLQVPEPDEPTKKDTIKAVMGEFHLQKQSYKKKIKGIDDGRRLTGKLQTILTFMGKFIMKKQFAIAGGMTVIIGFVIYGSFYHMQQQEPLSGKNVVLPTIQGDDSMLSRSMESVEMNEKPQMGFQQQSMDSREMETTDRYALSEKPKTEEFPGNAVLNSPKAFNRVSDAGAESSIVGKADTTREYASSAPKEAEVLGESGDRDSLLASKLPSVRAKRKSGSMMNMGRSAGIVGGMNSANSFMSESEDYRVPEYQVKGRDKFEKIDRNPVNQVSAEPVSTFSIDVDTASYAFIRRQVNSGSLPQKNAVRIEEMINYFDYDYPVPADKTVPFQPTVAVYPTPWNPKTKLLHIGIKGYDIVSAKKPRSNLVFLIDVSGSMSAQDKLPLLRNSFRMFVNSLDEEDTVAIIVYAGAAGTVLEPTKVKEKGKILAALDQLQAGGSTAGGEGIRRAYELAEANFKKDGLNRVILATDGDFNVGITNSEELKSFIERKRETGIFLSVLGFGQGNYNDALMQDLAQNGNGNAAYLDTLNEARKVLVDEASSTLFTIARDVKIQVEFNPDQVAEYRLIGYESRMLKREDFNNDKVDAGDIGSGHSVTAIYEITPVGSKDKFIDDLRYSNKKEEKETGKSLDQEYAFLKIRYKLPNSEKSELIETPIMPDSEYTEPRQVPADIQFAASVAAFGQLLRGGTYTSGYGYEDVIKLGETATGKDKSGYRHEFLNLVRLAASL